MESVIITKNILIVYAHPEPTSLTHELVEVATKTLQEQGHHVTLSDLYSMNWKAVFDEDDFSDRVNFDRLSFIEESKHAYSTNQQTADVASEQHKLLSSDAVIFLFPFWWFSMPAILKGWVDRVFAYGLAYYRTKSRADWHPDMVSDMIFYGAMGVILGGRIGYILFYEFGDFLQNMQYIYKCLFVYDGLYSSLCVLCFTICL